VTLINKFATMLLAQSHNHPRKKKSQEQKCYFN